MIWKKRFFKKIRKSFLHHVSFFGHSFMKEKHGVKTCFFKFSKKWKKVVHGVYSRKKESFLRKKIKSASDEIKKIPIFSFLIIKMDIAIHFCHRKIAVPVRKASSHWKITVFSFFDHFFGILPWDSVKFGVLRFREIRGYPYVPWSKCGFRFNFDFWDLGKKRDFRDPTKIEYSKTTYFTVLRKTRWQMIGQKNGKKCVFGWFY